MKSDNPKISVVIPAFNEEKYLPACLNSIKNQSFKDFEIIVVDNNSTDQTSLIAYKYGAKVVREKRQGTSFAREKGFGEARGEIIARTDADATVPPYWLDLIFSSFSNNPQIVAVTGPFTSPHQRIPNPVLSIFSKLTFSWFPRILTGHVQTVGANMAVRKETWQNANPCINDSFVHEDLDLGCHLARLGKILYLKQLTATCSLRKIEEKPIKGSFNYFFKYPLRYYYTFIVHHPILLFFKKNIKN